MQSNQLVSQSFVGTLALQQGYLDRYQAVPDRLFPQAQANGLQVSQTPNAN